MESKSESLLSKFTSFFREQGANDADSPEDARFKPSEGDLRLRLQRKRQDDAVRFREFQYLRHIIQRRRAARGLARGDAAPSSHGFSPSGQGLPPPAARDQHTGMDAAQLEQWWRSGAHFGGAEGSPETRASPLTVPPTLPGSLAMTQPPQKEENDDDFDLDFTGLLALEASTPPAAPAPAASPAPHPPTPTAKAAPSAAKPQAPSATQVRTSASSTAPAATRLAAHPVPAPAARAVPVAPPPAPSTVEADTLLRKAAIAYSAGDYAAAESHLLTAQGIRQLDPASLEMLTFALFDIYRATGQQNLFDVAALDYAERNGRSPAEWISLPDVLTRRSSAATRTAAPVKQAPAATTWQCPAKLDAASLVRLQALADDTTRECAIDWYRLQTIEPNAGPAFSKLIRSWCTRPLRLRWLAADALLAALDLHTRQSNGKEDVLWWRMHLDALCIMGRTEDFDNLAVDYCVTFEVSPPSWEPAACSLDQSKPPEPELELVPILEPYVAPTPVAAVTTPISVPVTVEGGSSLIGQFTLEGDVCGEQSVALAPLLAGTRAGNARVITVSCQYLRRVDFNAAKTLIAWSQGLAKSGVKVEFLQVPRLVLVFMLMKGLDQHASLSTRAT